MAILIFTIASIRGMGVLTIVILKDTMLMYSAANLQWQLISTGSWRIIGDYDESVG